MLVKSYDVFKLVFLFYQYLLFGFTPKESDFLILPNLNLKPTVLLRDKLSSAPSTKLLIS